MMNHKFSNFIFLVGLIAIIIFSFFTLWRYGSQNVVKITPEIVSLTSNGRSVVPKQSQNLIDNEPTTSLAFEPDRGGKLDVHLTFSSIVLSRIDLDSSRNQFANLTLELFRKGQKVSSENVLRGKESVRPIFRNTPGIETDSLELHFSNLSGQLSINDIIFSTPSKLHINRIFSVPRNFFNYISLFTIFWLSFFLLGSLCFLHRKNIDIGCSLVYSIGIAIVSGISLFAFLCGKDIFFWLIPIGALFSLILQPKKIISFLIHNKSVFVLQFSFALILISMFSYLDLAPSVSSFDTYYDFRSDYAFPVANYKQDFLMPFGAAKIFYYHLDQRQNYLHLLGSYAISDRTPLVPLVILPAQYFFGDRFFVYEAVIVFLVSLISCLRLPSLSKANSSAIFLPILAINQFFLYFFHFVPSRVISLFFIVNYYDQLFFQKEKNWKLLAFYSLLAFMVHPVTLPFIIFPALFLLVKKEHRKKILFLIIPFVAFVAWVVWGVYLGKLNPFLFSPLGTTAPSVVYAPNISFDWYSHLKNRFYNFLGLFFDSPNPYVPGVGLGYYRYAFMGTLTLTGFGLFAGSVLYWLKRNSLRNYRNLITFGILIPLIIYVTLLQGTYSRRGLAENLFPAIYFLLAVGIDYLAIFPKLISALILFLFTLENMYLFIQADVFSLKDYFASNPMLYQALIREIVLCYILYIILILLYVPKKE